jgi:hypothetical protein
VWGIVTIYEAVMNISFYYIVPSILIAVMLCDMLARAILAGLFYLFSFCNRWATIVCWLMKDLSIQKEYYYILFLLLFLTVAVLSSI